MAYMNFSFGRLYALVQFLLVVALLLNSPRVEGRNLEEEKYDPNYSSPPKGTIKTIKGEDGDIVDCVDIHKQPAFDHPLLKDHKIQMDPSSNPEKMNQSNPKVELIQPWHKKGSCSEGTVPIRRRRLQDLPPSTQSSQSVKGPHYEFATIQAFPTTGTQFYGGSATISIWDPFVSRDSDSSASTLLVSLSFGVFLEAGWIVYPEKYGDSRPRLFTYFTTDNSLTSRCWDLDCNGFVQVNNKYSLGSYITTISTVGGDLYVLKIIIYQDQSSKNWWLSISDTPIGYWPGTLFGGIEGAEKLEWGGTVYDSEGEGPHTTTDMGNGLFPDIPTNKAAYVCSLQYVDASFKLQIPNRSMLGIGVTNPSCYDAQLLPGLDTDLGLCFLFGGSGRNPACP